MKKLEKKLREYMIFNRFLIEELDENEKYDMHYEILFKGLEGFTSTKFEHIRYIFEIDEMAGIKLYCNIYGKKFDVWDWLDEVGDPTHLLLIDYAEIVQEMIIRDKSHFISKLDAPLNKKLSIINQIDRY